MESMGKKKPRVGAGAAGTACTGMAVAGVPLARAVAAAAVPAAVVKLRLDKPESAPTALRSSVMTYL